MNTIGLIFSVAIANALTVYGEYPSRMWLIDRGRDFLKLGFEPTSGDVHYQLNLRNDIGTSYGGSCNYRTRECFRDKLSPGLLYIAYVQVGWDRITPLFRVGTTPDPPRGVTTTPLSISTLKINFPNLPPGSAVIEMGAFVRGATHCTTTNMGHNPTCNIVGLSAGRVYDIDVKSATLGSGPGQVSSSGHITASLNANPPRGLSFGKATTTTITVLITPPSVTANVNRYEVSVKGGSEGQQCSITSTASPLECTVENLSPSHSYTIQARSCSGRPCSSPIEKVGWTAPKPPFNVYLSGGSKTSLNVTVEPLEGSQSVSYFTINVKGNATKMCRIEASASPLSCQIAELGSGVRYTFEAKACSPSVAHGPCSEPIEVSGWTLPNGGLISTLSQEQQRDILQLFVEGMLPSIRSAISKK